MEPPLVITGMEPICTEPPELPDTWEPPELPDTWEPPELPDTWEPPELPDVWEPPELPDTWEPPELPDAWEPPELPDVWEPPELPDAWEPLMLLKTSHQTWEDTPEECHHTAPPPPTAHQCNHKKPEYHLDLDMPAELPLIQTSNQELVICQLVDQMNQLLDITDNGIAPLVDQTDQ